MHNPRGIVTLGGKPTRLSAQSRPHGAGAVQVPSTNTARIQESHLVCVHILCAAVEDALGA